MANPLRKGRTLMFNPVWPVSGCRTAAGPSGTGLTRSLAASPLG
ncbi:MAG: hypothetical protein RIQ60_2320 [Pseudomonadota bacterium]|jgi:hypothetical protein